MGGVGGSSSGGVARAVDKTGAVPRDGGTTTTPSTPTTPTTGLSTEYEANRPQVMPVYNSPAQIESARRKRMEIMARSGRGSTNLRGNPGTMTYQSSFLGNVA